MQQKHGADPEAALSEADDQQLIELVCQRNEAALSELYDRYARLLFSVALHMVGSRAAAEEITLDAFTQVWEKAERYNPDRASLSTWMVSIARYRAIDRLRRWDARPEKDSVYWTDVNFELSSHHHNPEASTEEKLLRERVQGALAELPVEQRQALALAYFKGMSHSQIANALALPLGTVKTRIRLAMEKLRRLLWEEQRPA